MSETLLKDGGRAAIGSTRPLRHGLITAGDIRKFCAAVDDTNPLYLDPAAARAAGYADVIGPPMFAQSATRPVPFHANLLADGQYDDLAPPGLGHLQSLLAGQSWEFLRPPVAGERVMEAVRIGSVEERSGRNGNMVFVAEEASLNDDAGDPIVRSVNTLLLRPHPTTKPAASAQTAVAMPATNPVTTVTAEGLIKKPSMVSLFMFCAAIWGVHRIHYDVAYAQSEGLPSAILPGWMVSSFLTELATRRAGRDARVTKFSVRYLALAFAGDTLTCTASANGSELTLIATNQSGVKVAEGVAQLTAC